MMDGRKAFTRMLSGKISSARHWVSSATAAFEQVKRLPFEDLGFAKVDHHRALRNGLPEVVLGIGKTAEQIIRYVMKVWVDYAFSKVKKTAVGKKDKIRNDLMKIVATSKAIQAVSTETVQAAAVRTGADHG